MAISLLKFAHLSRDSKTISKMLRPASLQLARLVLNHYRAQSFASSRIGGSYFAGAPYNVRLATGQTPKIATIARAGAGFVVATSLNQARALGFNSNQAKALVRASSLKAYHNPRSRGFVRRVIALSRADARLKLGDIVNISASRVFK